MLQFVNEWQLHAVAFELDGHAHLPAWISPRNVFAPATYRRVGLRDRASVTAAFAFSVNARRLHQRRKSVSLSNLSPRGRLERPLLSASRAPFVLQRQRVPPAGFSHELLKIAAVLDGLFHVLGQLIRNVDGKTSLPAASVQRVAGMPLPRFAKLATLSNARAFPQRDGAYSNGPETPDCRPETRVSPVPGFQCVSWYRCILAHIQLVRKNKILPLRFAWKTRPPACTSGKVMV